MASASKNLTEGSIRKKMLFFGIPLMLTNILQVLFNISDVAVVGRFAGPEALGSVGSTVTLVALITGFLIGIGSGVNVIVARYLGAKNNGMLKTTVQTSFFVSLGIGVIISVLCLFLSRPVLMLLSTKSELIDGAVLYLSVYGLGMPALALYNYGNAILSASGDTKKPLYFLFASGALNVILNLFFVIALKMDVLGVALASVISQYLSATLILLSLIRSEEAFRLSFKGMKFDTARAKEILSLGVPAGLQNAIFQIANLFIQAGVNSFDAVMVEGNSAAMNSDALVYDVMAAFYTGCSSFIGQNFGAGKKDRILKSYIVSLVYSFGAGAIFGGGIVLFGRQFLSLFTTSKAVADAGMYRLTIMGLSYAFSAFMDNSIAASRGLGKSLAPTVIVILGSCVFRVIWIYTVFAYFHTITSLYLLYIFSWTITGVAEIIYFAKSYKKLGKGDAFSAFAEREIVQK